MNEEAKKRALVAVETALKLRMMATLPDDFLRFVSDVEMDPSPENLERIERWNEDMIAYLTQRAERSRQPALQPAAQPEQFVQSKTFLN